MKSLRPRRHQARVIDLRFFGVCRASLTGLSLGLFLLEHSRLEQFI